MLKLFTWLSSICMFFTTTNIFSQTQWNRYSNNPVLDVGPPGSWDAATVVAHALIRVQDTLKMWYMASESGTNYRIGYAWSTDGLNWTKDTSNPVLTPTQSWEENSVFAANVLFTGSEYKMWYTGAFGPNARIGYAWSSDGINWTKYPNNPVLIPGPDLWDNVLISRPYVIKSEMSDTLKMWYHGYNGSNLQIGYATAVDETSWVKHQGPVLTVGTSGSWDDRNVGHPTVYYDGQSYQMWFHGNRDNPFLSSTSEIGYAISSDGINWTKVDSINPILSPLTGTWESKAIFPGNVLFEGSEYHMWYTGDDGTTMRIGMATSFVTSVEEFSGEILASFSLEQNYPNPFNPATKIKYSIPKISNVVIKIFDILGSEIETLVNEEKPAGSYDVEFIADGIPSGVYFYQLKAVDFIETKKMVLMK